MLLVRSPKEIFDPSFQLTFLSVLAIVVIAWPLLLKFSAIGTWHPTQHDALPACVFAWAQDLFANCCFGANGIGSRNSLARRTIIDLFKVPLAAWLERCHLQRCFALRVWSGCGLSKRPVNAVAADDLLLSPVVVSVTGA